MGRILHNKLPSVVRRTTDARGGMSMIIFDGLELIGLAVMAVLLVICGIAIVIDRIVCDVKKRQQKRIDEAFKEEGE